ncbi:ABC transporter ATP-binding protein [candidate division WOR-3 bacterium]|nr:ABC transporter ATP-binding protein [candidate division WOR-3 bacterium]
MPDTVISVEHLSKAYRLGKIGSGTLRDDMKVWWAKVHGKPNPLAKIGQHDPSSVPGPRSSVSRRSESETIWALEDVSFEVKQGEILGIIGGNGAGKSTLLKIISQITAPTSGCIKAKGRVGSLLEVGTGFHPELTGRENIYLNGAILGMKRAEVDRKFDEIVAFSEVGQFIDTPVKRYSSGMYVRLAFAVAAHLDPEILLVDEVLAVGDAAFQRKCLGKMGDVAKGGRTVLFVSHNMASVNNLCNRGVLVTSGRVEMSGPVEDVTRHYLQSANPESVLQGILPVSSSDGALEIRTVEICHTSGHTAGCVQSGDDVTIQTTLCCRKPVPGFGLQFAIRDEANNRIAVLNSTYAGTELDLKPGDYTISCRIPEFPLVPGAYVIESSARKYRETLVSVPIAVKLSVEAGDFYGTGQLPPRRWWGICLMRQVWKVGQTTCEQRVD